MSDAAPSTAKSSPRRARKPAAKVNGERRSFAADEAGHAAADAAADLAARRRLQAMQAWANARTGAAGVAVRSRPATAIAAALGVGVIIGLLISRRNLSQILPRGGGVTRGRRAAAAWNR